jgi:hypothetical protein
MIKKRILILLMIITTIFTLTACEPIEEGYSMNQSDSSDEEESITYLAMMYDNQGNNFLNFEGKRFEITPNKVEQWGYNTSGSWTSYYDTSSVMTVNIDGRYIESCGSTILFKDTRLEMLDISKVLDINNQKNYSTDTPVNTNTSYATGDYLGLRYWWYNQKAKGQHGGKIVLIQSQDGYNIGAFAGDDVTWEVAGKLPKTTEVIIDGKKLYIHRCNFTIIDTELIDNAEE